MLTLRILIIPLTCLLLWAPTAARADWGLEWDVRLENEELADEIEGYFEEASAFFESKGFPVPLITGTSCGPQSPVVIENWQGPPTDLTARIRGNRGQCAGHGVYYCVSPGHGDCPLGLFGAIEQQLARADPVSRKAAVGSALFLAVMHGFEWFREQRPETQEDWLSWALPVAAMRWWLDEEDAALSAGRAWNYPLHAPLGLTELQRRPDDDWASEALRTALLWSTIRSFSRKNHGSWAWSQILQGALSDRWSYKINDLFYLDLLDAGLHQMLVHTCDSNGGRLSVYGESDICSGLCAGDQPLRIRYLDVEEDHAQADYAVCANAVGGLYFTYPIYGTVFAETYPQLEKAFFPNRPDRDYPDGCIPATVNRAGAGDGRRYAEVNLSIPPVAFECVAISDVPANPGGVVSIVSSNPDILDQLHLSHNRCARPKEVMYNPLDNTWYANWRIATEGLHPDCKTNGDKIRLVLTNVAMRASETLPADNLTLRIYAAAGEVN